GQVSLAHAGFFAVGAYGVAITTKAGLSFWLALPFAGLLAAAVRFVVGLPTLRTRGSYFAIATLCFGVIVSIVAGSWMGLTGGHTGIVGVRLPDPIPVPGLGEIGFHSKAAQYHLVLVFLLLTLFVMHRLVNSAQGLSFVAVRNNEVLAASVGVNTFATKLLSFVIASFFAGLAGGLYASLMRSVSPEVASINLMFNWVVYLLLGGAGTLAGPVVGALAISALTESLQFLAEYHLLIFGALLVVAMVYCPRGLVGLAETAGRRVRAYHRRRAGVRSDLEG
ncbi:MAG: branched-chain amino acid ABC transporter permease, partial [Firmicutes bacterium]|nr:branched-chain amino acid ABC transporter permease [Bacillota bacterium]